ncbi:hypothetical protein [Amycolatopsis plumensis]|uniref:Uncharacterized protein n=1 Tax=Amycolatopsis plumensis TaxID=236508 RepID=A0ABV5UI57_9PSEU
MSGSVEAKATWGGTLWTYTNRVDWCWDGQHVTTISPIQITADIPDWSVVLGWSYEGVKSSSQWDYFGDKWVYRSLTQALFKYCPPRVICVQEVLPLIALDTYGDGTSQFQWRA